MKEKKKDVLQKRHREDTLFSLLFQHKSSICCSLQTIHLLNIVSKMITKDA